MSTTPRRESTVGNVQSISFADPAPAGPAKKHRVPKPDERVAIRLAGHRLTYTVRVAVTGRGPKLTELTVTPDDGRFIDADTLKSAPLHRLATAAAQWIDRAGGLIALPDDTAETATQPENADPKVWAAAQIVLKALALDAPVRPTVAAELHVSPSTVDRLIRKAREEGFLSDDGLPRGRPKS